MKLLAVYPYVPYPLNRGAYHRAFQLLKALAQEHEVTLLALAENGEGAEHRQVFEQFCRRAQVIPFQHPPWPKLFPGRLLNRLPTTTAHWTLPVLRHSIEATLAREQFDAAHICDIVLAQFFLRRNRSIPLVADRTRVDLQYQWMEHSRLERVFKGRLLNFENFAKLWFYERAVARRASLEVVCGPDDEQFIRRFISRKLDVAVIPNGVDLEFFHSEAAPGVERAVAPTLIFCGAMDYAPNVDALRWFFPAMHQKLLQTIPDLQVLIVGRNPLPEVRDYARAPGVVVTGGVPDVRPYYRQAWAQIVPLRIGGGTRLKIVESMAMGTPVVSTTIGAQGLGLLHQRDLLLADNPEEFVQATIQLLCNSASRNALSQQGMQTVREHLAWPALGRRLLEAYRGIFGG
jgi:polysaccharide biosynthesis protein PslH